MRQAQLLQQKIETHPRLEVVAGASLNVLCFRYLPERELSDNELDAFNQELLTRLWEAGDAAPSYATIRGRFAIRCAFTNHRTRMEDLDVLLHALDRIASSIN